MIHLSIEFLVCGYIATFLVASVAAFMFIRSFTTHTVIHHKLIVICSLLLVIGVNIGIGISLVTRISRVPQLNATTPKSGHILSYDHPTIQLEFSDPVLFSKLQIHTFPERELVISPNRFLFNLLPFGKTLTVIPKSPFPLDSNVMVYVSNIQGPFTQSFGGETLLEFFSETKPKIISILSPTIFSDVSITQPIRLLLDKPSQTYINWSAKSHPEFDFSIAVKNDEIIMQPTKPLLQGVTYTISLLQHVQDSEEYENTELNDPSVTPAKTLSFTTTSPPFVSDVKPSNTTIFPSEPIQITFKQPMNTHSVEEHTILSPNLSHTYNWNSLQTILTIQHEPFPKDSSISAQIASGALTTSGGLLESPLQFDFRTPGTLDIHTSVPSKGQKNVSPFMPFTIEFNQPISINSHSSQAISIDPEITFSVIASSSSLLIVPKEQLKASTLYTIRILPSVTGTYGLPPALPLSISFTTQSDNLKLPVPFYKQGSAFTCNIASVRMLLAYNNIFVSEKEIIERVGSGGKRGTGNPKKGFLDDYGTYWDAISKGISTYSKNTVMLNGTLQEIISKLTSGTPVMIWGQNGWSDPHDISWTSSDGEYIRAINGMHSSVVIGFKGTPDNPEEIYLNDPWRAQYAISTKEFLRRWGYFSVALYLDK